MAIKTPSFPAENQRSSTPIEGVKRTFKKSPFPSRSPFPKFIHMASPARKHGKLTYALTFFSSEMPDDIDCVDTEYENMRSKEMSHMIAYKIKVLHSQHFHIVQQATVYNLVDETEDIDNEYDSSCRVCKEGKGKLPSGVKFIDHQFDAPQRRRLPGRKKEGTVLTERNSLLKGSLGVRWEKATCNEAKILPTTKMEIDSI